MPSKGSKPAAAPEDIEPGWMRKAYNFMGGATGLGGTGGAIAGAALAPETGGLSMLIPIVAAGLGGAGGAALEGKSPMKEGLKEGAMQGIFAGAGKLAKPAWQFAKESAVKTFGSRELVSEAAENLLRRWTSPTMTAKSLYDAAESTKAVIPLFETAKTVNTTLKKEVDRMPLDVQGEIKRILGPIQNFVTVGRGKGQQYITSQNVADAMADVRRLGHETTKAFKADNTDLGNALNRVRASLLDDLEKSGVPEVKAASKAFRKEATIDDLARIMGKPGPVTKWRDFQRDNPLSRNVFTQAEEAQIDRIMKKLAFVAPSGASGIIGKIATTTLGGTTGGVLGGLAGYIAPEYLRTLLASPTGRRFMEKTLSESYKFGPSQVANYLAPLWSNMARGLMSGGESEQ